MSRVVDSQAFVAGSGVSLTRIPEEKRRALDGFDYTFSDFLSYVPKKLPTVVPTEPTEFEIPEKRAFPSSHTVANALKYQ